MMRRMWDGGCPTWGEKSERNDAVSQLVVKCVVCGVFDDVLDDFAMLFVSQPPK
jgi:hypothetical protein